MGKAHWSLWLSLSLPQDFFLSVLFAKRPLHDIQPLLCLRNLKLRSSFSWAENISLPIHKVPSFIWFPSGYRPAGEKQAPGEVWMAYTGSGLQRKMEMQGEKWGSWEQGSAKAENWDRLICWPPDSHIPLSSKNDQTQDLWHSQTLRAMGCFRKWRERILQVDHLTSSLRSCNNSVNNLPSHRATNTHPTCTEKSLQFLRETHLEHFSPCLPDFIFLIT